MLIGGQEIQAREAGQEEAVMLHPGDDEEDDIDGMLTDFSWRKWLTRD